MRLPAFASAHSHAFQRAMRGRAQRPASPGSREDFWSWRGAMYAIAESLDPDSIHAISLTAFRELAASGVRTVGEFHYIHHQADGTPYAERTLLAERVIDAALEADLRITLLRVAYARSGPKNEPLAPAQRRFVDSDPELVLRDVETLRDKYRQHPNVRVGIAPHSVRAVPPEWIRILAEAARTMDVPLHMHVAEQPAEIEACVGETGKRPVELLDHLGAIGPRFCAVHATHLLAHEARLLGPAFACVCPTTERDLGDGLPDLAALRAAGTRICVGIDSHVICDPLEEIRALETGERIRTLRRTTATADALWREGSLEGARACGFEDAGGEVEIDVDDPALALVPKELLLDAVVFGAPARVIGPVLR
ncbi:MAG: formimidoylglutamate deiminase [Polyangiales bacterium]